VITVL